MQQDNDEFARKREREEANWSKWAEQRVSQTAKDHPPSWHPELVNLGDNFKTR